ncbi:hypothetical protein [Streptomyces sp. NPDC002057]|uniref:hypothetical protein n=1 Tax=Streptomyces sp. NPDC002057 TaxID=3154664 RepID=UPI00332CB3AC
MVTHRISHGARPWTGALRGVRAGVLAVLCVLLPLGGHTVLPGHTPRPLVLALVGVVALPLCLVLTRRRLSDAQVLAAFVGAQVAYHLCYVVPGACAALTDAGGDGHLPALVEHTAPGTGSSVLSGGHAITVLLAARLLGATESLIAHGRPLAESTRRILRALLPLLTVVPAARAPRRRPSTDVAPLLPASLVRPHPGRAPPALVPLPPRPFRPSAVTGLCLAV